MPSFESSKSQPKFLPHSPLNTIKSLLLPIYNEKKAPREMYRQPMKSLAPSTGQSQPGKTINQLIPAVFNGPNHRRPGEQTQPNLKGTHTWCISSVEQIHFIFFIPVCSSKSIIGETKDCSPPRA